MNAKTAADKIRNNKHANWMMLDIIAGQDHAFALHEEPFGFALLNKLGVAYRDGFRAVLTAFGHEVSEHYTGAANRGTGMADRSIMDGHKSEIMYNRSPWRK